ncbi:MULTISPECIES: DNA-processing protein DprA [unclassified Janthinobacterium]|uniref:DNA-processing protein DprA n=1 Tax=unclassified Janthinobacterium TaxID=2610881 RepID=UPI0016213816|nr:MULTISPECIES: DNA-processing protein DprA [unclassified Janthinobacterium]MBB5370419.1 DNA processing protein [Janthinobacterium sp. K2C7]MBB5383367.1 DNA processing protein [Janthinobacterium sp. K2Li3]MBB5388821.1 DNA processing protein [Janthinobacterium sp. K2E3]
MHAEASVENEQAANDLAAWLRLQHLPGVGPVAARALLARFGLPGQIFAASFEALREVVSTSLARTITEPPRRVSNSQLELTLQWLQRPGNAVLTLADAAYPPLLLEIADPPLLLYVRGRAELLSRPGIAIIGSRNASAQGMQNAAAFAESLSRAGLTIISGLALGIDTQAHEGGLRGPGSTVAVIGTGPDLVYPKRNLDLAQRIAEQGCVVSEYALGLPAMPANFPRRNRLISGLARGVLVIEAAALSGSLITARLAGEQGRDVYALPGSIHSTLAKGCHALIKQGAKLVESVEDVLQELQWQGAFPALAAGSAPEPVDEVLAALGHDPHGADTLAERSGLAVGAVMGQLLALEMAGLVERLPGGLFQRCK